VAPPVALYLVATVVHCLGGPREALDRVPRDEPRRGQVVSIQQVEDAGPPTSAPKTPREWAVGSSYASVPHSHTDTASKSNERHTVVVMPLVVTRTEPKKYAWAPGRDNVYIGSGPSVEYGSRHDGLFEL
jgi:hypothetical protein